MMKLAACPACRHSVSSPVIEPNCLILLDAMRDSSLARYDYRLCHSCGVVYASLRPTGADYDFIYANFSEFLGRPRAPDIFDDPSPLSEQLRDEIDRCSRPFWELSAEKTPANDRFSDAAKKYAAVYAPHAEIILRHLDISEARVLDVRSKTGYIGAALKRAGAAEVCATVMFPAQEYLVRKLYGLDAKLAMNFENFDAPFEGDFDLIVLTHMLTHAMRPIDLLGQVAERVRPGGHIYLCQDNDDTRLFAKGKNVIGEMKPFHFQQFDLASLCHALMQAGLLPCCGDPHARQRRRDRRSRPARSRHRGKAPQ